MTPRAWCCLFAYAYASSSAPVVRADAFSVTEWQLVTYVEDSRVPGGFDGDFSIDVKTPFSATHDAFLDPSSEAHSYFSFSWSPDTASFLIAASHAAFDGNGGTRSVSSGSIYITPSVDLLLTATGNYTYDLPGNIMQVRYGLAAHDETGQRLFGQTDFDDTFLLGPTTNVFSLSVQGVLPAGQTSVVSYRFILDALSSSGLLATGSGDIHFTLAPVPEPSTLALLALTAALLRRRRRRSSSLASRHCFQRHSSGSWDSTW